MISLSCPASAASPGLLHERNHGYLQQMTQVKTCKLDFGPPSGINASKDRAGAFPGVKMHSDAFP